MTVATQDAGWQYERQPNQLLRRARRRFVSPSGSGRPMSRQELAEAVNAQVFASTKRRTYLDASYIGKLERGDTRWPRAHVRRGFRAVLQATTDAEIGFFNMRRTDDDFAFEDDMPAALLPAVAPPPPTLPAASSPVQLVVRPGMALVVVAADHPLLLELVAEQRASA